MLCVLPQFVRLLLSAFHLLAAAASAALKSRAALHLRKSPFGSAYRKSDLQPGAVTQSQKARHFDPRFDLNGSHGID